MEKFLHQKRKKKKNRNNPQQLFSLLVGLAGKAGVQGKEIAITLSMAIAAIRDKVGPCQAEVTLVPGNVSSPGMHVFVPK